MFAKRISRLKMTLPQAGLLRIIAASEGQSQQTLAATLSVVPSKLVQLVDELEARGLIERRAHPTDRRTHALFLTANGEQLLATIGRLAREHEDSLLRTLSDSEREQLGVLLQRIAEAQDLTPGVHPGFRRIGRKT
jgi:DNA-binding MarR family transcriptional regulator